MEFIDFKRVVQARFKAMVDHGPIFRALVDKDELYSVYLDSFPAGTNPVFRERAEHDCSACRSFIKNAGSMVQIVDGELRSLWDLELGDTTYQPVADNLSAYVKSIGVDNVFLHPERTIGIEVSREMIEDKVKSWDHLAVNLPAHLVMSGDRLGAELGRKSEDHNMVFRALTEITYESLEIVQDLISQGALYRGAEKKSLVDTFTDLKREFSVLMTDQEKDLFCWLAVVGPRAFACRIRNDVIGTLLVDISERLDLEVAVKKFEDKVSGTNYKRPTALVTPKMKEAARQAVIDLGLMSALDRRYATSRDVAASNVLFVDGSARAVPTADVFDQVETSATAVKLDKLDEMSIEKFLTDVLPTARAVDVLVENRHRSNLVSLIAPVDPTSSKLFKWDNLFSWSYSGDVADSIKEKVKAAGGNVTGDVCCRLAWYNYDDLDLHMTESNQNHIFYANRRSSTGGELDVDMNAGGGQTRTPVENIFYRDSQRMPVGHYSLFVNQYARRETTNVGFEVEIDVLGDVHHFSYNKAVSGNVEVAKLVVAKKDGKTQVTVLPVLESSQLKKEFWGIKTQEFKRVSTIMLSPNFWGGQAIGNKHYFFMLHGCKNDETARGFYNEFLRPDLEQHRRTMELVGSKARTNETDDQVSGLGFSSTQRNSVTVRVHGSFQRTIKVNF